MTFADLGLAPELLRAVADKGYSTPTPIQLEAIPAVLSGRDVLAGAQTGTGKTAAFVLPILQKLGRPSAQRAPRALVLTPTRELAAQVAESARTYGKYSGIRTVVVFGGVGINPQIDALRSGCDILVATPGRLLDLQEQGVADLRSVECFVLDEADRMLDMGFIRDIKRVFKLLPPVRQNLMFSATYSDDMRELAGSFLRGPVSVQVAARNATADRVEQHVYRVPKDHKRHLLAHLINDGNWHQVLVFTRTKHGANRLAQQLEGSGIRAAAIHGNKSQAARVRALADFKANKVTALVATEVAARGLDIKELPQVVNYELPNVPEDYVHRIGRTARAGGTGCAVSLVSPDEGPLLKDIERLLRRSVPVAVVPQFEIVATPARPAASEQSDERHRNGGGHRGGRGQRTGGHRGHGGPHAERSGGGERRDDAGRRHGAPGGQHAQRSSGGGHGGERRDDAGRRHGAPGAQHTQRSNGGERRDNAGRHGASGAGHAPRPEGGGHSGERRNDAGRGQGQQANRGGQNGQRQQGSRRDGQHRGGGSRGRPSGGGRGGNRGARPARSGSGPSRMY
jgi:ATP-dependent RNA helicase RhlE